VWSGRPDSTPAPADSERQRDYWDDVLRGFGVRVSYGGKRAFVVRYRLRSLKARATADCGARKARATDDSEA